MISTKRQVINEQQKFGSFDIIKDSDLNITIDDSADVEDIRIRESEKKPAVEQPIPGRPKKQVRHLEKLDIQPSDKTINAAKARLEDDADKEEEEAVQSTSRTSFFSGRGRAVLCVYIVIAVVLAIAVIATGISISESAAKVDEYTVSIVEKQATVESQNARIADLTNKATVHDEAIRLGMVDASETVNSVVPRVEKTEYPIAEPHTNGFDSFCKWIQKIIA